MSKIKFLVIIISTMMLINVQMQSQNLGIGPDIFDPDESAGVEMRFTNKGLLIPRMTTAQRDAISDPSQSLLIFNTTTKCFETYVDNTWWTIWCSFYCGDNLIVTHTIGDVAPETKTVTYGTVLTDLTGSDKCWITQNLGASRQASSATDKSEDAAGWYWQFNRKQGYKVGTSPAWTITSINESSAWTAENDPCAILLGTDWRIPTKTEWEAADANGGWNNYNDTYSSVLKLHAAGYLHASDGSLWGRGSDGRCWSSTQISNTDGWRLGFYSSYSNMNSNSKAFGFSLRCLRD